MSLVYTDAERKVYSFQSYFIVFLYKGMLGLVDRVVCATLEGAMSAHV